MKGDDDIILVRNVKQGDEDSFNRLFDKYRMPVYSICYRFIRNDADAREIVQDVFIKIYRNIKKFNEKAKFFTWLYRITINTCISFQRRQKRHFQFDESISEQYADPESLHDRIITRKIIEDALMKLPGRQRMALILKHFQGHTFREIGESMGISTGAAKANHYQAMLKLREYLKGLL